MTPLANPLSSPATSPAAAVPASFIALMYHNITPDAPNSDRYSDLSAPVTSYFLTRSAFAAQLQQIASLNARCMNAAALQDFYAASSPQTQSQNPAILLTFDDGWADVFTTAADLLRERRIQALVFVTTDFLTRPHCISRSALARIDFQTFHIGSHAVSHRMLCLMDERQIRSELADSKKILEDITARPIDSVSIPNGAVDVRVRSIARECGYRFLFDSEVRINHRSGSPFQIGRVSIKQTTSLQTFTGYIRGHFSRERLRRAVLQGPKRILGLRRYDRLRRRIMGEKEAGTL